MEEQIRVQENEIRQEEVHQEEIRGEEHLQREALIEAPPMEQQRGIAREAAPEEKNRQKESTVLERRYFDTVDRLQKSRAQEAALFGTSKSKFAVSLKLSSRDKRELTALRSTKENPCLTAEDMLLLKGVTIERNQRERAYQRAASTLNLPNPEVMKERFSFLTCWMEEGKEEENQSLFKAFAEGKRASRNRELSYMADEILSYDFSEEMLDEKWLAVNGQELFRQINRAEGFLSLLSGEEAKEFRESLPRAVFDILLAKGMEAKGLRCYVETEKKRRGLLLSDQKTEVEKLTKEEAERRQGPASEETLRHLREEFAFTKQGEITSAGAVLSLMKTDAFREEEERKEFSRLSYRDFAALVGTKNRGQITATKDGVGIMNNHYGDALSKRKTRKDRLLRERIFAVSRDRLRENASPEVLLALKKDLGLEKDGMTAEPLTRLALQKVLSRVNELSSEVDMILKQGNQADKTDHSLAILSAEMFAWELDADDAANPSYVQKKAMKQEIQNVLKEAKELNPGFSPIKLSEHQLDNMVGGNISLLRDNLFFALRNIHKVMENLNGGKQLETTILTRDNALIKKTAALVIARMATRTEKGGAAAEEALKKHIMDTAFLLRGKEALKKDVQDLYNGDLDNGSEGIHLVLEKRGLTKNREEKKEADAFILFCDQTKELLRLEKKAVNEGITEEEADQMKSLGKRIDSRLRHPEALEKMIKSLGGTRYASGAERFLRQRREGISFGTVAKRIAETTIAKEVRAERKRTVEEEGDQERIAESLLHKLPASEQDLAKMLLLRLIPSDLVKKDKDAVAKGIVTLRKTLQEFPKEGACLTDVVIGNTVVRISQKRDLSLHVSIGGRTILLPLTAELLRSRLEEDICGNPEKYGIAGVRDIVRHLSAEERDPGERVRVRKLCVKTLSALTKKNSAFFDNLSLKKLVEYAKDVTSAQKEPKTVVREIETVENKKLINNEESLSLLALSRQQEEEMSRVVVFLPPEEKEQKAPEPEFTEEEKKVQNLLAEILFGSATWETDEKSKTPGKRLEDLLRANMDTLFSIWEDDSILDRVLDALPFPKNEGEDEQDIKAVLSDIFTKLFTPALPAKAVIWSMESRKSSFIYLMTKSWNLMSKVGGAFSFAGMEEMIDANVQGLMEGLQSSVTAATENIFQPREKEARKELEDPEEEGITEEEKERRLKEKSRAAAKELEDMMLDVVTGKEGQGKFIQLVLQNYFSSVDAVDQRAMLAMAFRSARPVEKLPDNVSPQRKRQAEEKRQAEFLKGLLLGAGPLFQKILQGLPEAALPELLKPAIAAMKSELAPIPEPFVKAQLFSMVKRSKGKITRIEVKKPLGAASVGQAFLCRVYGPSHEKGKNVVVKLLRPDVRNRMMREKEIMKECARKTDADGGMLATYEGQLERIEEELDLTVEARNAERGLIYEEKGKNLHSVKISDEVEPSANTLVMDVAPGITVDRYMKEVNDYRQKLKDELDAFQGRQPEQRLVQVQKGRRTLLRMLKQLETRQKHLRDLAEAWVTEGVYGEGFYHGDLHAGNIMISDNGATVIDYGNATKLTPEQQSEITRMMAAAAVGDMEVFRSGYHNLLKGNPDMERKYQQKRTELGRIISDIFKKGDKKSTGQRIALALLKAQNLGLQIPAAIYNFSQSQLRMQNTVDEINGLIAEVKADIRNLDDDANVPDAKADMVTQMISNKGQNRKMDKIVYYSFAKVRFGENREDFLKGLRNVNYRNAFDSIQMNFAELTEASFRDNLQELVSYIIVNVTKDKNTNIVIKNPVLRLENDHHFASTKLILGSFAPDFKGKLEKAYLRDPKKEKKKPADLAKDISEEMEKVIAETVEKAKPFLKECDDLRNKLLELRRRQDRNEGELHELELSFFEDYEKLHRRIQQGDPLFATLMQSIRMSNPLNVAEEAKAFGGQGGKADFLPFAIAKRSVEAELQDYFEDREHFGPELKKAYETLRYVQEHYPKDEDRVKAAEDKFFEQYLITARGRLEEVFDQILHETREPDSFYDVMGDVIDQNLKASLKRVGFFKSITYQLRL